MEPRVFISSTFYDLKYIREEIGTFVTQHGFQPLRSENGDIGYEYGKELDESCYKTIRDSDLAILIIGGRYGSPASTDRAKAKDFDEFISVTRKEFNEAVNNKVPVSIFIEENVHTEYSLYKANKEKLDSDPCSINFVAVDSINVHRFIDSIYGLSTYAVVPFKNVEDIKNNLTKQWADMFLKYLKILQSNSKKEQIDPAINNIYLAVQSMQKILETIGECVVGPQKSKEYQSVIKAQMVEKVANLIADTFSFISTLENKELIQCYLEFFVEQLIKAYEDGCIDNYFSPDARDIAIYNKYFEYNDVLIVNVKNKLKYYDEYFTVLKDNKNSVIKRLMKDDYLKKMKLI